jgi:hypothetical protein
MVRQALSSAELRGRKPVERMRPVIGPLVRFSEAILEASGLPRYEREARASKLDPFKHYIDERVKAATPDWIPATPLLRAHVQLNRDDVASVLRHQVERQTVVI